MDLLLLLPSIFILFLFIERKKEARNIFIVLRLSSSSYFIFLLPKHNLILLLLVNEITLMRRNGFLCSMKEKERKEIEIEEKNQQLLANIQFSLFFNFNSTGLAPPATVKFERNFIHFNCACNNTMTVDDH